MGRIHRQQMTVAPWPWKAGVTQDWRESVQVVSTQKVPIMKEEPTSFRASLPGGGMEATSLKTCSVCSSECTLVWLSAVARSTIPRKLDGARRALELYCMRKSSVICRWRKESACSTSAAQTSSRLSKTRTEGLCHRASTKRWRKSAPRV